MASPAAPNATIDWASAEVRGGELTLPLKGWLSGAWVGHLVGLVAGLPVSADGLTITVTSGHIRVTPVRRGAAPDVHALLECLVDETNAAFATDQDEREDAERDRRARARSIATSLLLMALAVAAVALQWAEWSAPIRAIVVLTFIVVAPGWALLRVWGLAGDWAGVGLAIALSLALAMVLAAATIYAGIWSPLGALAGLAAITVLACVVSLTRVRRPLRTPAGLARP